MSSHEVGNDECPNHLGKCSSSNEPFPAIPRLLGTLLCTVSPANAASFIVGEGVLSGISVGAGVLSGIQAMPASPIDEIRAT